VGIKLADDSGYTEPKSFEQENQIPEEVCDEIQKTGNQSAFSYSSHFIQEAENLDSIDKKTESTAAGRNEEIIQIRESNMEK